jgi:hypothetical protein
MSLPSWTPATGAVRPWVPWFCRVYSSIAREALLLRDAQLRIKSNLDCSGLLITRLNSTTLAVWDLADLVPDDLLLMTVFATHATARLQIGAKVVENCR